MMLIYDSNIDDFIISDELEDDTKTDEVNGTSEESNSLETDVSSDSSDSSEEDIIDVNSSDNSQRSSGNQDVKSSNEDKNSKSYDAKFIFPHIIGKKIGMTQLYSDDGTVFPATIVEAGPCLVTQIKNTSGMTTSREQQLKVKDLYTQLNSKKNELVKLQNTPI